MADFYLIIVLVAVFRYFDEKEHSSQRKKAKRRLIAGINRISRTDTFQRGFLFVVHKRRAFLWRVYRRITNREFTIPAIQLV